MVGFLFVLMSLSTWAGPSAVADVAGRWSVNISGSDGAIGGVASLDQQGDKVTGWMGPKEDDTIPVSD
jgi:hypothetical protein